MSNSESKRRIAVLDDEADVLKVIKKTLERKGYETLTFSDPYVALEELKKQAVDLVITDLRMPGMDGLQFLYRLRQIRESLPVIFLTGHATIDTAVKAVQYGAFDYLRKPYQIQNLYQAVERALAQ